MEFYNPKDYHVVYWAGQITDEKLRLDTTKEGTTIEPILFHSAMTMNKDRTILYCCAASGSYLVTEHEYTETPSADGGAWTKRRDMPRYENDTKEMMLQLKIDKHDRMLLATTGKGFVVWDMEGEAAIKHGQAIYLALPHGVRNITTKMMQSNSIMVSSQLNYAVAGVRKNLYVWCLETAQMMKVLDAHFGRIIQLEALTIGNWNSVITSSIDRSVKVWNINNIFEQVHVIDRHELQIDSISLSRETDFAVTVTRGCVGVWDIRQGRLLSKLADSPLGAIVTHAEVTSDGKYIISSETGKVLIWNRVSEQVIYRDDQPGIQQITFMENNEKVLIVSCANINASAAQQAEGDGTAAGGSVPNKLNALATVRPIPDGQVLFSFEFPVRTIPGIPFRCAVITADGAHIVVVSVDKGNKDCVSVYSATNGSHIQKITLKGCNIKVRIRYIGNESNCSLVPMIICSNKNT